MTAVSYRGGRGSRIGEILAYLQLQPQREDLNIFKHRMGPEEERRTPAGKPSRIKTARQKQEKWSEIESERVRFLQGDVRRRGGGGVRGVWRDIPLPICQRTACPPLSYLKNLVSQCNMAPPQSLQLAVWALFGVVS